MLYTGALYADIGLTLWQYVKGIRVTVIISFVSLIYIDKKGDFFIISFCPHGYMHFIFMILPTKCQGGYI